MDRQNLPNEVYNQIEALSLPPELTMSGPDCPTKTIHTHAGLTSTSRSTTPDAALGT